MSSVCGSGGQEDSLTHLAKVANSLSTGDFKRLADGYGKVFTTQAPGEGDDVPYATTTAPGEGHFHDIESTPIPEAVDTLLQNNRSQRGSPGRYRRLKKNLANNIFGYLR